MAFGAVFMLVPLRMLQIVLTSTQNAARRQERPVSRTEPWTADHPWKPDAGARTGGPPRPPQHAMDHLPRVHGRPGPDFETVFLAPVYERA